MQPSMKGWWTDTADSFGNIGDWFGDRLDDITGYVGDLSAEWQQKVAELKTKAAEFTRMFTKLENRRALAQQNPALAAEYDRVMSVALNVKNTIEGITQKIDSAVRGFSTLFGEQPNMGAMGAVPLLPIAVVAGAITAITAWLTDAYALDRTLDAVENLVAKGMTPAEAWDIVKNTRAPKPWFSFDNPLASVGGLVVAGVAVYFFWPTVQKWLK